MLTNEQAAQIDYLKSKGIGHVFVRPETPVAIESAQATLIPHQYGSFSATLEQLTAYYELKNQRYAEVIAA